MRRSGTLVMCTLGVGDVLLAQPLLAALRGGLDGRLVVLARAGSPAQLARRLGIADLVVDYVARWPHRVKGALTLSPWIARQHFSLVLTTTGLNPYYSGLMALASNAPDRISERRGRMTWAWTHVVDVQTGTHTVVRNRSLGQAVGVTAGTVPRMSPAPAEMDRARKLLADHEVCIAVTPGSNKTIAHKRWPLDKFAALIVRLRTAGAHVVVLGGPDEGDMGRQLTGMTGTDGITELIGATDVGTAGAVLSRCRAAVGNDGMLLHLAAAVGTPTVAIFGPSDPTLFSPVGAHSVVVRRDLDCAPCDKRLRRGCPERCCLAGIEVSEVSEAVDGLVGWAATA